MKTGTAMKYWAIAISLTILGGGMSACAGGSAKRWKEEVQLSDGRIIVVEREAIYVVGGDEWASNRSGSKIDGYRIRYAPPDGLGKIVEWRSTKKDFQTYPEVPLVFDLLVGQPTVFSLVRSRVAARFTQSMSIGTDHGIRSYCPSNSSN